ncbi:hypothetical protein [Nonomuraea sp. B19D2]|uniref:hypothetical protein n=1 Tax=Nonomuraea sp. B19D2 TaxID=3159561 RepID=UPI0032DB2374
MAPPVGITPRLSDAELVTLAMMQAILGFTFAKRQPDPGHHHLRVERRRMGRGLHPVGPAPAPGLHPSGPAHRLRPDRAKANERETLLDLLAAECELLRERHGQTLIGDKNYFGRGFEREERHRGRTPGGVIARVMQRILALTAAIWHNDATGQTVQRSLTAYDH